MVKGIANIIQGVDASSLGLGNADWRINFFNNYGITSSTEKTALNNLSNSIDNAGLWDYIQFIAPFAGNSQSSFKGIFHPYFDEIGELYFGNNGSNSPVYDSTGYTNVDGAYIEVPFNPISTDNLTLGVYSSGETASTFSPPLMNAVSIGEGLSDFYLSLNRKYLTTYNMGVVSKKTTFSGQPLLSDSNASLVSQSGLLQFNKVGRNLSLLNNATILKQVTRTSDSSPVAGGTVKLKLCAGYTHDDNSFGTIRYSNARISFAYVATFTSLIQAQQMQGFINTYLSATGKL